MSIVDILERDLVNACTILLLTDVYKSNCVFFFFGLTVKIDKEKKKPQMQRSGIFGVGTILVFALE